MKATATLKKRVCMFRKQNLTNMHTQNQDYESKRKNSRKECACSGGKTTRTCTLKIKSMKAKEKTQEKSVHVREVKPPEHAHSKSRLWNTTVAKQDHTLDFECACSGGKTTRTCRLKIKNMNYNGEKARQASACDKQTPAQIAKSMMWKLCSRRGKIA